MHALCETLLAQKLAGFVDKLSVPGGAKAGAAGYACGWNAIEESGASDSVWAIRRPNFRDMEALYGMCVPEIASWKRNISCEMNECCPAQGRRE